MAKKQPKAIFYGMTRPVTEFKKMTGKGGGGYRYSVWPATVEPEYTHVPLLFESDTGHRGACFLNIEEGTCFHRGFGETLAELCSPEMAEKQWGVSQSEFDEFTVLAVERKAARDARKQTGANNSGFSGSTVEEGVGENNNYEFGSKANGENQKISSAVTKECLNKEEVSTIPATDDFENLFE